MADNTTLNVGTLGDVIASDDVGGVKYQVVKVATGGDGFATMIGTTTPLPVRHGDGTNQETTLFDVDTGAGSQHVHGISLRKAASGGSVEAGTSTDPLRTDPTGTTTQPVSGTVTANLAAGSNNIGDVDILTLPGVAGDVAHDAADSGNPVKVGGKAAVSALPTAVANNDRANLATDRYGRHLFAEVDHGLMSWKAATYTTQQTGTALWTPASGKVIVVTYLQIAAFAVTAGRVTVWFGGSADTTYTEGTDKVVFDGNFVPSATSTPGAIVAGVSLPADAADRVLRVTTDAAASVRVVVHGFEVTP